MITPNQEVKKLAQKLGIPQLFFKREDLHPYQSHKGRSIPFMIDTYLGQGKRDFVISSSGNAALAALLHVKKISIANPSIKLKIILGLNIDKEKADLLTLAAENCSAIHIESNERPLQKLKELESSGYTSLRQSTDDLALVGYKELAQELLEIDGTRAVFLACSSGTTSQALLSEFLTKTPQIEVHLGQTTSCHPFVNEAYPEIINTNTDSAPSIAGAIVDRVGLRKTKVVSQLKISGGDAYITTDEEIVSAIELVKETEGIILSPNSAISVACLIKALEKGWRVDGSIVCLICGR